MDSETSEAIEVPRTDLHEVEVRLSGRVDVSHATLRREVARMREDLRSEFRDGLAENRRHAEVLFQAVRDDIRMVADGVTAFIAKVDALSGRGR